MVQRDTDTKAILTTVEGTLTVVLGVLPATILLVLGLILALLSLFLIGSLNTIAESALFVLPSLILAAVGGFGVFGLIHAAAGPRPLELHAVLGLVAGIVAMIIHIILFEVPIPSPYFVFCGSPIAVAVWHLTRRCFST